MHSVTQCRLFSFCLKSQIFADTNQDSHLWALHCLLGPEESELFWLQALSWNFSKWSSIQWVGKQSAPGVAFFLCFGIWLPQVSPYTFCSFTQVKTAWVKVLCLELSHWIQKEWHKSAGSRSVDGLVWKVGGEMGVETVRWGQKIFYCSVFP